MKTKQQRYDDQKEASAKHVREMSAAGRDIAPIPKVKNPSRRRRALKSLRKFLETYFADSFALPWAQFHFDMIADLERIIVGGGLGAQAIPRASGKTTVSLRAALWAVLCGHRKFLVVVAATERLAEKIILAIRSELQFNDRLAEDFPEVCHSIRKLENITKRQAGQTLNGVPTMVRLAVDEIIFPTIAGSKSSGSIIRALGLTGAIRGQLYTTPEGQTLRPDIVLVDDAQTRESAKSPTQTEDREALILGDVLGLAGPDVSIACMMLCTVIYSHDLSDRFLDPQRHPTWNGRRVKMMPTLPARLDLWDQYAELRRESFRVHRDNRLGDEFYQANRAAMDAGAVVSWQDRKRPDEISAIQHAMNLRIDKPKAFAAEYQNESVESNDLTTESRQIEETDLILKLNTLPRGMVPRECNRLTAFIDVQADVLFYAVCAWSDKFGGAMVDYGVYPSQPVTVFTADAAPRTLAQQWPQMERPARIYKALSELTPFIMSKHWPQVGSSTSLIVSQCLIDSGFETEAVHDFLSRSTLKAVLKASKGRAIKADQKPMNEYRKEPRDVIGWNWRIDASAQGKGRFVSYDTLPWKSRMAEAILAAPGSTGSFYFWGDDLQRDHPLLTIHMLSEYRVKTSGGGRVVEVWKPRPDTRENHWWDCLIGCAVAASVVGVTYDSGEAAGEPVRNEPPKQRVDHRAVYEAKRREFESRRNG